MNQYPLLDKINSPKDLRELEVSLMPQVCKELRQCVLNCVSKTGGHLASGLGVVELTVALHYVFNTPVDGLVWDVGHQAYPHKILTERRKQMSSLKQLGGISGFPSREESEYDSFGVGHSSTSISAILGMDAGQSIEKNAKKNHHIAVIGDGAMTAGIAFEAIHHAASLSANILVVLNDNDMSISPNVGGFSSYLSNFLISDLYQDARLKSKNCLKKIPSLGRCIKRIENRIKEKLYKTNIFEDFGFDYTGPKDGHDVIALIRVLQKIKEKQGPKILHIRTKKGKGYKKAENSPTTYHGVSKFSKEQGVNNENTVTTFTDIFSKWICAKAFQNEKIIAITPAMCEGSGLVKFSKEYPKQYFDVAIAEQHALTFAAGVACKDRKPVVAIYSTFLQRAYDQLIHDIALQKLDVLIAVDRAGIVGQDGATHSGCFDIAFCRIIPNLIIMAPSNSSEMLKMLNTGYNYSGPVIVRYPREKTQNISITDEEVEIGKARVVNKGEKLAILVFGSLLSNCKEIALRLNLTLVDMRFVKPIDKSILKELSQTHNRFLIIEEGVAIGGVSDAVKSMILQEKATALIKTLAVSDEFTPHGTRQQILELYQLDQKSIENIILEHLS